MNMYQIVGGELVDPTVPESVVKFNYTIFAKNMLDAADKFYTIFPSCFIVECNNEYI